MKNDSPCSNVSDWYAKGHRLMQDHQYRKAIVAFGKAIEGDMTYAPAYFYRGVCFYLIGNHTLSNDDMKAAVILGYQDAQLWSKFEMKDSEEKTR